MDLISISSAIAGLVSLADLVNRAEVRFPLGELKDFSVLLHSLSLVAYDLENTTSVDSSQPHDPNLKVKLVFECQKILKRTRTGLEDIEQDLDSQSKIKRIQARLRWPFSASETKELIQNIQHHKHTINLAINADSLEKLKTCMSLQEKTSKQLNNIQATIREILDIETRIAMVHTKQDVLDFFSKKIDNRSVFDMHKGRRHPLTCLWFLQSEEFQEWQNTPGSKLWVTGIPGTGKSVISSVIIAECLQHTAFNNDSETQNIVNIVSSLPSHVARQDEQAFQMLQRYYEDLRNRSDVPGNPSTKRLTNILIKMASLFDQLCLIVDGLDECGDDADLVVQTLSCLPQENSCITMALISRNEHHISETLDEKFIPIEIEAHTEDVEIYLRLRNVSIKDDIIAQLVQGARGM
ncbi:hypothetical protein F4678DRAFT_476974 [Xylaria arbuscula]|nr:hypothetical protein F4678DRAFT_476974 [Xylaria arbuscula]